MSDIQLPKKLKCFFQPKRHKVTYGGRGSAKSWSIARMLLILGAQNRMRILCTREVQKSIKQSVHTLLRDQIEAMGLADFYAIYNTEIRGINGTEITFSGLREHTIDSIKSFEGCDVVWVEEAHSVSKRSWEILIPTIRKEGSEIWVSFNPELDTDETYRRFVVNPPPDSFVVEMSYQDNPWFSDVLEKERIHCQQTYPDDYETIWEGKCRTAVVGAIYAKEIDLAIREHRITHAPYDPSLKVHTVWDLGWNDSMAIGMVQKMRSEVRLIDYIQDDHKTLDWYVSELRERRYNWAYDYLPHDGNHQDYRTGKSAKQILEGLGRRVIITPEVGVEHGIRLARMMFARTVFNKPKTETLVECLKRYRRRKNATTGEFTNPLHDEHSHGADMFRYIAVNEASFRNEEDEDIPYIERFQPSVPGMPY